MGLLMFLFWCGGEMGDDEGNIEGTRALIRLNALVA